MSINAAQLLRTLGSGLIPSAPGSTGNTAGALGGIDFATLLNRARSGELTSGRAVTLDTQTEVEFTSDQMDRLSQAADAADAAGVESLFAVIDGIGVVMDVPSRTIRGTVDLSGATNGRVLPADVLVGVDSVVVVPDENAAEVGALGFSPAERRAALAPLAGLIENGTLIARLASGTEEHDG